MQWRAGSLAGKLRRGSNQPSARARAIALGCAVGSILLETRCGVTRGARCMSVLWAAARSIRPLSCRCWTED
jgi:hypothetical protein